MDEATLVLNIILYVLLPLWGLAGMLDWWCHRQTEIEKTSGLKEAYIHCLMGVQICIPLVLSLLFEVNVLIMLMCFAALIAHEVVAHYDVHFATGKREISIWEVHAHNYLATLPFFLLLLIIVRKWDVFLDTATLNWSGGFSIEWRQEPLGSSGNYATSYMVIMAIFVVFPYMQEWWRCYSYEKKHGKPQVES
ncbi:MAG: diguanylate cyclase [Euryarchaeota archaeon]|nr:diguanylate cyclase [Euryarchaeota archaeon]|tara:strand:+ start:983 stop:1561 length:579 start_codon:yes stop_codon:yes gene_type:complete